MKIHLEMKINSPTALGIGTMFILCIFTIGLTILENSPNQTLILTPESQNIDLQKTVIIQRNYINL